VPSYDGSSYPWLRAILVQFWRVVDYVKYEFCVLRCMRAGLIVAGVFLLIIGFFLTLTIIGAIIGIPIGLLGFIMMIYGTVSSGKTIETRVVYAPPPPQYSTLQPVQSQSAASTDTKFCQFCGSKISRTARFCPSCGKQQP